VVVIGGGFGGIGAAVKLKQAGIESFVVLEQSPAVGGTWWDNTFPGAQVDIHSHLYSYSFYSPYDFERTHATQAELQKYLEEVVDHFGVRGHFRFNTTVRELRWSEQTHTYAITTDTGEELIAHAVVCGVGLLSVPRHPTWPGLDCFRGIKFHTARWEHEHDLTGKRVAVVGTGATASQVVPELSKIVDKLYLFQREPGWLIEKGDRTYTAEEREDFRRHPWKVRLHRAQIFLTWERGKDSIFPGTKHNKRAEEDSLRYLEKTLSDRPDLVKLLTPDYPFWGKRPLINSSFYPALLRENVELVPWAVESVTETGVVDTEGVHRDVDVIVMATGYTPTDFLATLEVYGRDGRSIHDVWNGEPEAFLGSTVAGFPNFYMLYGPNTNASPCALWYIERGQDFAVGNIRRMVRSGATAIEVRKDVMDAYNEWLQRRLVKAVYQHTNNYYKSASGRNVTQFCHGGIVYWFLTRTLSRVSTTERFLSGVGPARGPRRTPLAMPRFRMVAAAATGLSKLVSNLPPVTRGKGLT
jgi:cation diffusion facilitator CzcD-associated flavoprotein CzcO